MASSAAPCAFPAWCLDSPLFRDSGIDAQTFVDNGMPEEHKKVLTTLPEEYGYGKKVTPVQLFKTLHYIQLERIPDCLLPVLERIDLRRLPKEGFGLSPQLKNYQRYCIYPEKILRKVLKRRLSRSMPHFKFAKATKPELIKLMESVCSYTHRNTAYDLNRAEEEQGVFRYR